MNRLRKLFTSKRPHHCRACGWTGWLDVSASPHHVDTWTIERDPPDLGAVDAELAGESAGREIRARESQY